MGFIPASLLYALPLIPFFVLCWSLQSRSHRILNQLGNQETNCPAEEAARKFLESSQMTDVPIEKGDDYSKNEFDEESNRILLSPDTVGFKDVASIGLALRAVSQALFHKREPNAIKVWKMVQTAEIVLFWIVFSVLSFGLTASNFSVSLVGYALGLGVLILYFQNVRTSLRQNQTAVQFLDSDSTFSEDERRKINKVLFIEAMKF